MPEEKQLKDIKEPPNDSWGTKPDEDIYGSVDDATRQRIQERLYDMFDFHEIEEDYLQIEEKLRNGEIPENWTYILDEFLQPQNQAYLQEALDYFPRLGYIMELYIVVKRDYVIENVDKLEESRKNDLREFFGQGFELSTEFINTNGRLADHYARLNEWPDDPPQSVFPWEMRIGLTTLLVPPINVDVNTNFRVGSLSGGAIRQPNAPKYNSGHSETSIQMTLYFPTHESIWGITNYDTGRVEIDVNDPSQATQIDQLASSLRGLITQFKYAPFLPIRNAYLNQTYGITAVTMHSMSISTLDSFPYCLVVQLNLLKFNHNIYLPMVQDFHQAIHWGRYRHYIGRAMLAMDQTANQKFLEPKTPAENGAENAWDRIRDLLPSSKGTPEETKITLSSPYADYSDNPTDIDKWKDSTALHLFYPMKTPNKIFAPDTSFFRTPEEDWSYERDETGWNTFLNAIGINVDSNPEATYDSVVNYSTELESPPSEREVLLEYLRLNALNASEMNYDRLQEFIDEQVVAFRVQYKANHGGVEPSDAAVEDLELHLKSLWFAYMYTGYKETPWYHSYIQSAEFKNGKFWFDEWAVPMSKMTLDPDRVIINGVSVTLANSIGRQQIQMQDEPAHQHLGGKDSTLTVSLTVVGEDDLIQIRRLFKHIQGLARLEAAHGVLGFLGIKNYITALAGIKYLLPMDIQQKSIPGYPHVYDVTLTFVDFDILQQKREQLSSDQQKELIDAFGKRNPFFRVKQLWANFNAYPDLPLTVRDENGKIVGSFAPDYYFRGFKTFDDDIYDWNLSEREIANAEKLAKKVYKAVNQKFGFDGAPESDKEDEVPVTEAHGDEQDWEKINNHPTGYKIDYGKVANRVANATKLNPKLRYYLGAFSEDQSKVHFVDNQAGALTFGEQQIGAVGPKFSEGNGDISRVMLDETGSTHQNKPSTPGLVPQSAYQHPYADGTNDPTKQFELMMADAAYRDIDGRMVRAFPTYMLWLIDEGGRFAGVKLFDNFYGLQSVVDFSVARSEDIMADTLVLRLSNLYGKLSLDISEYLNYDNPDDILANSETTTQQDRERNLRTRGETIDRNIRSGMDDQYVVELQNIRLKPGVRVHLRTGYSADPNALDTIFNGVITEVQQGEIVTVVAQSDAVELSGYINTTDNKGHSGTIDGALNTGLWLSEPRDLMVRLLSMGSSRMKEAFSAALNGMVYSESRFGIRHFGMMLYEPLSDEEKEKQEERYLQAKGIYDQFVSPQTDSFSDAAVIAGSTAVNGLERNDSGEITGFSPFLGSSISTRAPMINIMHSMAVNFFRKRDFEIYKRNIYPGNGSGIAQFLGGDLFDGGTLAVMASANPGSEVNSGVKFPVTGTASGSDPQSEAIEILDAANDAGISDPLGETVTERNAAATEPETADSGDAADGLTEAFGGALGAVSGLASIGTISQNGPLGLLSAVPAATSIYKTFSGTWNDNPVFNLLGLTSMTEDDLAGFDEVSFRAQTYMKTVWDMFQLCAALLPNYIVAVRPFEDRSTVFYGKPHWLYTSGLIPVTTGIPKSVDINYEQFDQEFNDWNLEAQNNINPLSDMQAQVDFLNSLTVGIDPSNPTTSTAGMSFTGGEQGAAELPTIHENGAVIPTKRGKVGLEMHLPTTLDQATRGALKPSSQWNVQGHKQLPDLPDQYKFPEYCHLPGTGSSGFGAFGALSPEDEQWYMNMRWPYQAWPGDPNPVNPNVTKDMYYPGRRILCYCIRTGKAVVCTPAEAGPAYWTNVIAGMSPDAMHVVGAVTHDEFIFGWVPDGTPLGPVQDVSSSTGGTTSGGWVQSLEQTFDKTRQTVLEDRAIAAIDAGRAAVLGVGDFEAPDWIPDRNSSWYDEEDIAYLNQWDSDPYKFAYEHGWRELPSDDNQVPVYIEGEMPFPDAAGTKARRLYDEDFNKESEDDQVTMFADTFKTPDGVGRKWRTKEEAESIWHQFRKKFPDDKATFEAWKDVMLDPQGDFNEDNNEIDPATHITETEAWVNSDAGKEAFQTQMDAFMAFMWKHPYARAWLVLSTHRRLDRSVLVDGEDLNLPGGRDLQVGIEDLSTLSSPTGTGAIAIETGVRKFANLAGIGGDEGDKGWDLIGSPVFMAWLYWVMPPEVGGMPNKPVVFESVIGNGSLEDSGVGGEFLQWLRDNYEAGRDADTLAQSLQEGTQRTWDKTIGKLLTAVGQSLNGLINMFRMSLQQLGWGLDMMGTMQRQANILNGLLNDSIYYSAGEEGGIERLVDNPFTREYGEPVVEIREPFQRMHFLSSFQHIISNGINETTTDVATVITASSDGKYPVTVHFDKGAPPDRQVEKAVETGIFWDNAKGNGWSSFLHPLVNPIETMRAYTKMATGSSDELLSKRIALWHLKESLKDIYTGEIIVAGDPSIRPYDLVYLADVYERMYGMFEVEQVVHTFDPVDGFYTAITPNAIVTINDPARWSMISWVWAKWSQKNIRDDARQLLHIKADGTTSLDWGVGRDTFAQEIAKAMEPQMRGHVQYTHGNSALVRDLSAQMASGMMPAIGTGVEMADILASSLPTPPGVEMITGWAWDAWKWVRDNLLDQHGCYIQYLTKDGQPMDAGLSYNQGVAVGRHHSINLLPGILGIPMEVDTIEDGHRRITTNDLLKALGWSEYSVEEMQKQVSWWVNMTNINILETAGVSPDPVDSTKITVEYVEIGDILDGDTIKDVNGVSYRLTPVAAPEVGFKENLDLNPEFDPGKIATEWVIDSINSETINIGHPMTVAVRINEHNKIDSFGRTLGVIFHRCPPGTPADKREEILRGYASRVPVVPWDSFMEDGRPYTLNWELIMSGMADVYMKSVQLDNPDKFLKGGN